VYLLVDRRAPVWAGAAFAVAISIKIVPVIALPLLLVAAWRLGRRRGFEPDGLSNSARAGLRLTAWVALGAQVAGWGHLLVGSLPYAIYGTVTLREIGTAQASGVLWLVLGLQIVVYGALALGFRQLLGHTMRYGVVPVARHRGRA
jgi:cytochrome d ubiquinol oxidase subunit I